MWVLAVWYATPLSSVGCRCARRQAGRHPGQATALARWPWYCQPLLVSPLLDRGPRPDRAMWRLCLLSSSRNRINMCYCSLTRTTMGKQHRNAQALTNLPNTPVVQGNSAKNSPVPTEHQGLRTGTLESWRCCLFERASSIQNPAKTPGWRFLFLWLSLEVSSW